MWACLTLSRRYGTTWIEVVMELFPRYRPAQMSGFSLTPPASPWGINVGGGLNSTALIVEARARGLRPDWT
jgi:hypothetical protein